VTYYDEKAERNRALLTLLHPGIAGTDEPPSEPEGPPNFDGGVREPAPGPSDPEAEHNQTLLPLLQSRDLSGGGGW
jgi:hypothetical protein